MIRKKIENLNDGEFIDLLDSLFGIMFGLTATEWIERLYKTGNKKVVEMIDEIPEPEIIENNENRN